MPLFFFAVVASFLFLRWLPLFFVEVVASLVFGFGGRDSADAVLRGWKHVAKGRADTVGMVQWDMLRAMGPGAKASGMVLSALASVSVLKQCRVQLVARALELSGRGVRGGSRLRRPSFWLSLAPLHLQGGCLFY